MSRSKSAASHGSSIFRVFRNTADIYFSPFWTLGIPRSGCQGDLSSGLQTTVFPVERERVLVSSSSSKETNPIMGRHPHHPTSLSGNYLSAPPPPPPPTDSTPADCRLGFQRMRFGGTQICTCPYIGDLIFILSWQNQLHHL